MTRQYAKKPLGIILTWLCILMAGSSCERKQETSISTISQEMCECYSKQKGDDIDARMGPCVDAVVKTRKADMERAYNRYDSDKAVITFLSAANADMVTSCDDFGSQVEMMYDKWYPLDSSAANLDSIRILESKYQRVSDSDTAKKAVLHKLIAKNIEARRLEEGLQRCQQMKKLFKNEGGAYYASAFIYNLQKKYPEAINELKQEISISGDKNLELIVAVTKRKAQRNK